MPPRNSVNRDLAKALRFEGMDDVLSNLSKVIDKTTGKAAKEVYIHAAVKLRNAARDRVPVDTGTLRDNIFAARGDENKPNALVGVSYKRAPHAHLIEYGTVRAPAHPYLRPAISATSDEMRKIMETGLRKIIEEAASGRH